MRFKPGQKVVCVNEVGWEVNRGPNPNSSGPKLGDIVTVHRYCEYYFGNWYIVVSEWRYDPIDGMQQAFKENNFEPLMDITELTEILEQQPEHA